MNSKGNHASFQSLFKIVNICERYVNLRSCVDATPDQSQVLNFMVSDPTDG